ncbi:hypothetical protein PHMEG_00039666, partial [Phytophthora megakarya]
MKKTLDSLDAVRCSKFVLLLTMWKSRKPKLNHIEFREGLSYRFEKVHSLRLMYGNPTGSIQIRGRLRAVPLVITGDDTSNKEDGPQTTSYNNPTGDEAMVNVTLEMCVLRIEDGDKNHRLELIDRDLESQFDKMKKTLDSLDAVRCSKFVLLLTMWKSRKPKLNHIEFREELSYRFEKVHSLRLMYGNPTGSIQIRGRLRAVPLVITGDDTSNKEDGPQTTSYNNPTGDVECRFLQRLS